MAKKATCTEGEIQRLRAVVEAEGGSQSGAARVLDIPLDTLKKALGGEGVRPSTHAYIRQQLAYHEARAAASAGEGGAA